VKQRNDVLPPRNLIFARARPIQRHEDTWDDQMRFARTIIQDCLECMMQYGDLERLPYLTRSDLKGDEVFSGPCILFEEPSDSPMSPGITVNGVTHRQVTIKMERGFVSAVRPQDEMRTVIIGAVLTIDLGNERFVL
jgi:hypothetical protein